jgi:TPP-dependent pyruvate/acetoin dehydrogenase alpha subunit
VTVVNYPYKEISSELVTNDLSPELLVSMYRSMLRIRRIEEAVESKYHEDQMKTPIHLVIGQEATSVGPCSALRTDDLIFASHRTHGNYLAKGGDLKAMIAEFFCKTTGCAGSRGGSMHLLDKAVGLAGSSAICGGAAPIATGAALSARLKKKDYVSGVYFGDGAAEEGSLWESINFAALKKLPVLYLCENNFYSVCTPLYKRQPEGAELYKKAAAFGAQAILVDGTNVLECYEATRQAAARARQGGGPTFIEMRVYRWRSHGGAGNDIKLGYRDSVEGDDWHRFDPIALLGDQLKKQALIDDSLLTRFETEIAAEIKEAFDFAIASPVPTEADLYTHVFSE